MCLDGELIVISRSNKELHQVAQMKPDWVRENASPCKKDDIFL